MRKLIVHIEYESNQVEMVETAIEEALADLRERLGGDDADIGWRYFRSLGDAEAWESGEKGIEEVGYDGAPGHDSTPNGCEEGCPACELEAEGKFGV